jgi:hypothetical protein
MDDYFILPASDISFPLQFLFCHYFFIFFFPFSVWDANDSLENWISKRQHRNNWKTFYLSPLP